MGKKILITLATFLLLAIIAYLVFINLPGRSVSANDSDFSITAVELLSEYQVNENQSNKKYIGKTIEVNGAIDDIDEDEKGSTVIFLKTSDEMSSILCTLTDDQKSKSENLNIGDQVTLVGICSGINMDVVLNRCVIK